MLDPEVFSNVIFPLLSHPSLCLNITTLRYIRAYSYLSEKSTNKKTDAYIHY